MAQIDLETAIPIGLVAGIIGVVIKVGKWLFELNKDVLKHTDQLNDIKQTLRDRDDQLNDIKSGQVTLLERMMRVETLLSTIYESLNKK